MHPLYRVARPLMFMLDAEKAHTVTVSMLKTGFWPAANLPEDKELKVTLWDRTFPNPLGMAAGFDKNADIIAPLLKMGFGFVEAGTVTPKPQDGNPKPRIFRCVEEEAVINRMGFPGRGLDVFRHNLEHFLEKKPRPAGLVGLNIGMNKDQTDPAKDYVLLVRQLGPLADYLTVNISSPNTPGLRDLQKREHLLDLVGQIREAREKACGKHHPPPILIKLAPDLDEGQQEELATALLDAKADGLILTNTTLARPQSLPEDFSKQTGGLSGAPLKKKSTEIIHNFYRLAEGRLPIVGCGGIMNADDAYEKIRAGSSLIQLYTGLVYYGPFVIKDILTGLKTRLEKDGFTHIGEAVGADVSLKPQGQKQEKKAGHAP